VKYWFAFLLFVGAISMAGKDLFVYPARIPFVAVLAIAGIFCLTAAEVQTEENALKYRRFLVWKQVTYDEIFANVRIHSCQDLPMSGWFDLCGHGEDYILSPPARLSPGTLKNWRSTSTLGERGPGFLNGRTMATSPTKAYGSASLWHSLV
jgi:hypothetical protein